ncbi:(d)CMP kinase [Balneolales bacterium ANBcel1]|nr:(d)CMP kinase [Balneolales bacterium ANBcel1]
MIIVIDGPAGAGKSTTAREIARQTGFDYVDSGAIYRGLTYLFTVCGNDQFEFLEKIQSHGLRFDFKGTEARVFNRGREITRDIRSGVINDHVSRVAAMPEVREVVRGILREESGNRNVVLEGRDLGTDVFPDADLKFFLTADQKARARRRYDESIEKGESVTYEEVLQNVEKRDRIDSTRAVAPLKKADDAIEIDSTSMTFDEQVTRIMEHIRSKRTGSGDNLTI